MWPLIYFALQPILLVVVLTLWHFNRSEEALYIIAVAAAQLLLGVLEALHPTRPHWRQDAVEKLRNISIVLVIATIGVVIAGWYASALQQPLANLREQLGLDIWPHHWPGVVQVLMVFTASEFIWYWIHRGQHRWAPLWRASGHGVHHSLKRLEAINFGVNHPLESFFLVLPAALVEFFFGVGTPAAGAAILVAVQASMAHANIPLNHRVVGWFFTTNYHHIRHHSVVLEESNTNYGCAVILWDRLFGTYSEGDTVEAGTGPTEPTLWQKVLMPFKEPEDTAIAPQ